MRLFTRSRLVLLLALAIFASGWLRLPLPAAWLSFQTEIDGLPLELQVDTARLSWARGRLEATEVHLRVDGRQVLRAPRARLHIGLLPFQEDFLRPWLIELHGPQIHADAELLRRLPRSSSSDPQQLPQLAFSVEGGQLDWVTDQGQALTWEVQTLRGRLAHRRSDVRLAGRMLQPVQSFVRAKASAEDGLESWWFQLEGENSRAEDAWKPQDIEALHGMEVRPGQYSFRVAAQQEPGQPLRSELQLSLQNASAEISEPPLHLSQIQLHANGGLREGVRAEIRALVDEDFRVLAQGRMQWPEEGPAWFSLRGDSTAVLVDQDRLDWVRLLHPITAEILEALEIRGGPEARFAMDWHDGGRLGWAVHADTSGMRMRYRGIVTTSGEKPSFPYPVESTAGDFVAAGRLLMMDVEGRAGVGTVAGHGVVELREEDTGLYLDVSARGVAVDREIRAAATGTPQLAELWRQLGIPQGGTTDVDLRIRADDARETVGLTIQGVGRGVAVRPLEMPIPLLLDPVEYYWTNGYAWFDTAMQSPGGPVRLRGEIRDGQGAEYPSVRAILEADDLGPDLRTRRILVDRLGLPDFLKQFAPDSRSHLRFAFHQPATAEAAQYLLDVEGESMQLDWGTALGARYIPLAGVDNLRGRFHLAGTDDVHRFVAPGLDARFSGRPVAVALDGGSYPEEDGGLVVSSQALHLPLPAATALVQLLQLDRMIGPFQVEATSDLLVEWRSTGADPLRCRLRLDPLRVRLPEVPEPFELYGELMVANGRLDAPEFRLVHGDGWIDIHDLVFDFATERQELSATLDAERGIAWGPEFAQLLGPEAGPAFRELGLAGRVAPENLKLHYLREEASPGRLRLSGGRLRLADCQLLGPPELSDGAALIDVDDFVWIAERGVEASLRLHDGRGMVAGAAVRDASGRLTLTPEQIRLEELEAQTLGGWIRTRRPSEDSPEAGVLSLGLAASAPVEGQVEFGDLQLGQLQDQLALDAGARGVLRGWLELDSPTREPLDYRGHGRLNIEEGRLTTVPILEQLWGLLGVEPPVFRRGSVHFRLDGDGRVRIEDFVLRHDLLSVAGKGWIHLDGFVRLKVSLRRVRLFLGLPVTDLPIVSQFFDLFIEQEVFGPIDRLQLAPRSVRKLLGRELPAVPTPLWIPEPRRSPPSRSPIFPLHDAGPGR